MTTTTTRDAARPAAEWVTLSAEVRATLDTIAAHAASCGQLGCGHLGKSPSRAVRRAVILYAAEAIPGVTLNLDGEAPEVAAVLGVLRTSRHARPVYVRQGRGFATHTPGLPPIAPDPNRIRMTAERVATFSLLIRGWSANEVATHRARALETIKSHMGYLRRETDAHDSMSALLALRLAGRLADPAIVVAEVDDGEGTESTTDTEGTEGE